MIVLDPPVSPGDLVRVVLALVRSQKAEVLGIYNSPPSGLNAPLILTAERMIAIERLLGFHVEYGSGYRSEKLNARVGGAKDSQHRKAEAVDFTCPEFGTPRKLAERLALEVDSLGIDQLILEPSWVHVSFALGAPRREVLTKTEDGYVKGLA